MRLSRIVAIGGASLIALAGASTASAAAVITPSTGLQDGQAVNVAVSGFGASPVAYITQCGKNGNDDATFDFSFDCYNAIGTQTSLVGGAGSSVLNVFKGVDPQYQLYTCDENNPCWIRISPSFEDNTGADEFYQITFAAGEATTTTIADTTTTTIDPGSDVPEAPVTVLLPLTAAAVGGAALFMTRRRRGV